MPDQGLDGGHPIVLVIDDDPAVLSSLKFSLEIEGYDVWVYLSAGELLNNGRLPIQGCLVIDQVLPDVSGLDLIQQLRSAGSVLPAILITTNPGRPLRERAARLGVPIVEKPLLGNTLSEAIRDALGRLAMVH
jgi:two-component system, LuxR family, response regulator FixJ